MWKRVLLFCLLSAFALFALWPVAVMALKTVAVDEVSVVPAGGEPGPGFSTGRISEIAPDSAAFSRLKIDLVEILAAPYAAGDAGPFREGAQVYFSPPLVYFKGSPDRKITLFLNPPPTRSALWDRAVIESVTEKSVRLDVEKMTSVVVPNTEAARLDLKPGMNVSFLARKRFSLSAYGDMISDSKKLKLLLDTLVVALLTVAVAVTVGSFFAVAISKINTPGRGLLSALYIVPLLIPPYITAIAWTLILGEKGALSEALKQAFGWEKMPISIYGVPGSVLVLSMGFFPIVTLLVSAGLRNLNADMEEAGLMAAGRLRTAVFVSLRATAPYILSGAVFVFAFTLSCSAAPFLLRLQLFSSQVLVAFQTDMSGGQAMAVGMPLQLLAVGAVVFQGFMESRRTRAASAKQVRSGLVMDAGRWRWAVLLGCLAVLAVACAVPVGVLAYMTKSPANLKAAVIEMGPEIKTSIWVSALAATLAAAAGSAIGWLAARAGGARGVLTEILVMLPYAAPAAVLGAGMIEVFNRPGILGAVYSSEAILVWLFVVRFMPFAVKPAASAVKAVNPELEEAARVHGSGPARTVVQVTMRLSARGIAAGWILVFILSMGELDAALLVHPAGCQTMPIRIFNAIHFGHVELVSGLCLILVFAISLPLAVYCLIAARRPEITG